MSLLRQTKKRYYENLNEKSAVDNKLFSKTVKSLLSGKVAGKDKIDLIENNDFAKTGLETPEAVVQMCYVKNAFLELSYNSQENTCARAFFNKVCNFIKKRLRRRCFLVNFMKFLRTPF